MENEIFAARRAQLEAALQKAALDLTGHTGSAGCLIPIPNTSPPLYIVVGDKHQLGRLASYAGEELGDPAGDAV